MVTALLAQDAPPPAGRPAADAGPFGGSSLPLLMGGLFFLFWITVLLPQSRKQKKDQQQMLASIKPGARVVTAAGIIGTVVRVKDDGDEVTLRSEDSKLKVLKSTVTKVLGDEPAEAK